MNDPIMDYLKGSTPNKKRGKRPALKEFDVLLRSSKLPTTPGFSWKFGIEDVHKPRQNTFGRIMRMKMGSRYKDSDYDGVPDYKDCQPNNPFAQDITTDKQRRWFFWNLKNMGIDQKQWNTMPRSKKKDILKKFSKKRQKKPFTFLVPGKALAHKIVMGKKEFEQFKKKQLEKEFETMLFSNTIEAKKLREQYLPVLKEERTPRTETKKEFKDFIDKALDDYVPYPSVGHMPEITKKIVKRYPKLKPRTFYVAGEIYDPVSGDTTETSDIIGEHDFDQFSFGEIKEQMKIDAREEKRNYIESTKLDIIDRKLLGEKQKVIFYQARPTVFVPDGFKSSYPVLDKIGERLRNAIPDIKITPTEKEAQKLVKQLKDEDPEEYNNRLKEARWRRKLMKKLKP
jgi:hypothetical protein